MIAPSLPGFGFSEAAAKKGLGPDKIAVIMRNLMVRAGLNEFYIQAGDWVRIFFVIVVLKMNHCRLSFYFKGSIVGSHLSALYPENVLGYHTNYINIRTPLSMIKTFIASFYPSYFIEDQRYVSWMYPYSKQFNFLMQETGYFHEQATKPDTIGVGKKIAFSKNLRAFIKSFFQ